MNVMSMLPGLLMLIGTNKSPSVQQLTSALGITPDQLTVSKARRDPSLAFDIAALISAVTGEGAVANTIYKALAPEGTERADAEFIQRYSPFINGETDLDEIRNQMQFYVDEFQLSQALDGEVNGRDIEDVIGNTEMMNRFLNAYKFLERSIGKKELQMLFWLIKFTDADLVINASRALLRMEQVGTTFSGFISDEASREMVADVINKSGDADQIRATLRKLIN